MANKAIFLTKKYSMALAVGLFLSTSSAQANQSLMNNYSHCLVHDSGLAPVKPDSIVSTHVSTFYATGPTYLTAISGLGRGFNPDTGTMESLDLEWKMAMADPDSIYNSLSAVLRIKNSDLENIPPDTRVSSESTISGPGVSYYRKNDTRLSDIPIPGLAWLTRKSCISGSDSQVI
ncbi:MAG: hypothetical protein L3J00_05110 [Thiomicrorhabdus sp.]|nr:hypothetical protein [Thiomicrorhabdus sp.]